MRAAWTLLALDLRRPAAAPAPREQGRGVEAGLGALWRWTLEAAVDDGGSSTGTAFRLDFSAGRQEEVPHEAARAPALAALRAVRKDPGVLEGLVREHLERLHGQGAAGLLDRLAGLATPEAARRFLAGPRVGGDLGRRLPRVVVEAAQALATGVEWSHGRPVTLLEVEAAGPGAWRLGGAWGVRLLLRAHGYDERTGAADCTRFDLLVEALLVEGQPVRCRLELEDTAENGWYRRWVLDEASAPAAALRASTEAAFRDAAQEVHH